MIGVLSIILILLVALYDNRQRFYESGILSGESLIINKQSEKYALETIRSARHIVGVAVVSFHFEKNTRQLRLFVSENDAFNAAYRQFLNSQISKELPLFTENQDNNKTLIELFSGETLCKPFQESFTAKYAHNTSVKTVCAQSIPPYYGKFRGCLLLYLDIELTPEMFIQVRSIAKSLATKLDNPSTLEN